MADNNFAASLQPEAFFIKLYKKALPSVARHIARMGGSLEEAQDIFQDALVIYYEKVVSGGNADIKNESAYLFGVAKKLWLRRYNAQSQNEPLDGVEMEAAAADQPAADKLMYYLETAGKKCLDLLKAHYYDYLKIDLIAARFGYSGTHSATVAKYKCLEKIRNTIKEKSLTYADFIE